jgi:hypothetical protein
LSVSVSLTIAAVVEVDLQAVVQTIGDPSPKAAIHLPDLETHCKSVEAEEVGVVVAVAVEAAERPAVAGVETGIEYYTE